MAKRSRQSILKRQRELKKAEKAEAKRLKRQDRRQKDDLDPDASGPPIDHAMPEASSDDGSEREAVTMRAAEPAGLPVDES